MHEWADFALYVLVGFLGWLLRQARSWQHWRRIQKSAARELADPEGTNIPQVAIARAVIRENAPRIRRESVSIVKLLPKVPDDSRSDDHS